MKAGDLIEVEVLLATPKRLALRAKPSEGWSTPVEAGPLNLAIKVTQ